MAIFLIVCGCLVLIRWRRKGARAPGARSVSASRRPAACFAIWCTWDSTETSPEAKCLTESCRSLRGRAAPA